MPPLKRRSIRMPEFDYSQPGAYFVTLVTWNRENLFAEIVDEVVILTKLGLLVKSEWERLPARFGNIQLDEFVVMPNHLHGIICIIEPEKDIGVAVWLGVGARQKDGLRLDNSDFASPLPNDGNDWRARQEDGLPRDNIDFASPLRPRPPASGSLGNIVGAFKSTTVRLINGLRHSRGDPVWQRNYYEHVIRNPEEWQIIRAYIQSNPINWGSDNEHP